MRIADALSQARHLGVDRLDAQLLLAHLTSRPRAWLLAHDEAMLDDAAASRLRPLLERRASGEPLAYVIGQAEFCGLQLTVAPAVLIPRPETELLVEWAIERMGHAPARDVIDLGTGSGAIALAVKAAIPHATVVASDASADAIEIARANGGRHALEVEWRLGDWWAPHAGQRFGLALSNPPYVAEADPHLAALLHEPRAALTSGRDGLADLVRIVDGAPRHLLPGAWLLLEHGHDQADAVSQALRRAGFGPAQTRCDLAGMARCTGAAWAGEK